MKTRLVIIIVQFVLIILFGVYAFVQQSYAEAAMNEASKQQVLVKQNAILAEFNAQSARTAETRCSELQKQLDAMKK